MEKRQCFCCGKDIKHIFKKIDALECALEATIWSSDGTYGSRFDGIVGIKVIICDTCLENAKDRVYVKEETFTKHTKYRKFQKPS